MTTALPPMPEPQYSFTGNINDINHFTRQQLEDRDAQWMERINALEAALRKANSQAEHFEREWYLRGDQVEKLDADRAVLREALEKYIAWCDAESDGKVDFWERVQMCRDSEAAARAALKGTP